MRQRVLVWSCLIAVLAASWIVRFNGITFGFPIIVHPDEPKLVDPALSILATGDLNPRTFLYPSLYIYMQSAVYLLIYGIGLVAGAFRRFSDIDFLTVYYWGRMLTIVLSVGTIFLVYLIGRVLLGLWPAVIATTFIAASYLHIVNSFTITTDSPMTFWIALSYLFSLYLYVTGPRLRYYVLSGICIGCAIGTKYTAFWGVVPLFLAHLHHTGFRPGRIFDKRILLALALIPAAFIVTTPFAVLDHRTFLSYLHFQQQAYSQGHPGHESVATSYRYYSKALMVQYGIIPLVMGGIGAIALFFADKRKALFLISFPLVYFIFLGAYKVHFERNIVCLVPFLALAGGYGVASVMGHSRKFVGNKYLWIAACLLVAAITLTGIYGQAKRSVVYISRITLPDTRWVSKIWIEENLPAGARIAREHYTPPIDPRKFKVTYLGLFGLIKNRLDFYDYIIASSSDYSRFLKDEARYPDEAARYKGIFSAYALVKEFVADNKTIGGPTIRIYKVR